MPPHQFCLLAVLNGIYIYYTQENKIQLMIWCPASTNIYIHKQYCLYALSYNLDMTNIVACLSTPNRKSLLLFPNNKPQSAPWTAYFFFQIWVSKPIIIKQQQGNVWRRLNWKKHVKGSWSDTFVVYEKIIRFNFKDCDCAQEKVLWKRFPKGLKSSAEQVKTLV